MINRKLIMRLENACKSWYPFNRRIDILSSINLCVYTGESLAIMGPSGAGKSTMLHVLGLLTPLEKGTLYFDEQPVSSQKSREYRQLRSNIGFIFQDAKLINDINVLENVCVPLAHRGIWPSRQIALATEALIKVGLNDHLNHKPNQLSGGELMRVAIARALVQKPRILLVDEPTGNLDSKTGAAITDLLFGIITPERTMVFVTHHEPLAMQADRVIYLKDGKLQYTNEYNR